MYYPLPPGFGPAPPRPAAGSFIGAIICWVLLGLRDVFVALIYVAEGWRFVGPLGAIGDVHWWAVVPLVSLAAAAVAAGSLTTRRWTDWGTYAAVAAAITGSFPGLLVVGPGGILFGGLALFFHLRAHKALTAVPRYPPWPVPPPPPPRGQ